MIDPEESDRRIEQLERALAQLQTETTYQQIEANLGREKLKKTLNIAVRMAFAMDATLDRMADDLNGSGRGD